MTDIAVIILTKNEKLHIKRCLEKLAPLEPRQIFVVDCFSSDGTQEIVKSANGNLGQTCFPTPNGNLGQTCFPTPSGNLGQTCFPILITHEWPGNQAAQFNWVLDNLLIEAKWILRIDADEWLTPELIDEIKSKLPIMPEGVNGVVLKRRHVVGWLGSKWIKHGMYPTRILRLFRTGHARYAENVPMDEHLILDGNSVEFANDFVDESLISLSDWKEKHRGYAIREARMAVEGQSNTNKRLYYKFPPYLRAFIYFCIRYFLKLGFLDGLPGFRWHFWQGLWYRWIVDREIGKMKLLSKQIPAQKSAV